jgi:hypothetical protein
MDPSQTQTVPKTHAEVSYEVFQAFIWTFIATTLVFLIARLIIRIRVMRRLLWDDALVILAWCIFLSYCLVWKFNIHLMYEQYEIRQGKRPFDLKALEDYDYFLKLIVPQTILFYSGLWAVKFSFLAFFFKLGDQIRHHRIWWWCVLVVTTICYVACIADIQYKCTTTVKPMSWIIENCIKLDAIQWVNRTFYANCAMDIITDFMILSIPALILWNTRIPLKKKILLFGVFGVTIAIMVIAIIRVVLVNSEKQHAELVWLYFWSMVETGVAIMIANVASFRQLFVASTTKISSSRSWWEIGSGKGLFSFLKQSVSKDYASEIAASNSSSKAKKSFQTHEVRPTGSEEAILPLDFITVQRT